jgi:hypothetical protein
MLHRAVFKIFVDVSEETGVSPEVGGSRFFTSICKYVPEYTVFHP